MAQINIKIKTNDGADIISSFAADKNINNVSRETNSITTKNDGINGKSWATSYLSLSDGFLGGENTYFQSEIEKYNGYMFGSVNNDNEYELIIDIEGSEIDKIIIIGDKNANQFPTEAILDEGTEYEKKIFSDDYIWGINFKQEANTHTIKFTKWNRANYNACFTTLSVFDKFINYGKGAIDNLETISQTTTDASSIQYGILSNYGNVKILDLDGELNDYIKDGIIEQSNTPIEVYLNNKLLATYITSDSNYVINNKILDLQLTDDFKDLKNIYISEELNYHTDESLYGVLYRILQKIYSNKSESEINNILSNMTSSKIIYSSNYILLDVWGLYRWQKYDTIESYLKHIKVGFEYYKNKTVYELFNYICEITQTNLIKDSYGNLKFLNARPIIHSDDLINAIKIPKYYQISELDSSLFNNNKYKEGDVFVKYLDYDYLKKDIGTKTLIFLKDSGSFSEVPGSVPTVYASVYDEVYNDKSINKYDISIVEENNEMKYFKSTLTYDISNLISHKEKTNFSFKVSNIIEGKSKSTSGLTYTYGSSNSNYNITTENSLYGGIKIKNINISDDKKTLSFDLYSYYKGGSGLLPSEITLSTDITVFAECYEKEERTRESNLITIESNDLLSTYTSYYFEPDKEISLSYAMSGMIRDNILNDYKNGVSIAKVDIFCGKFNNDIDFYKGKIFDVNQIVYFEDDLYSDKTQRYWRITGVKFYYDGSYKMSLDLQEIAKIYDFPYYVIPLEKISVYSVSSDEVHKISVKGCETYYHKYVLSDIYTLDSVNYIIDEIRGHDFYIDEVKYTEAFDSNVEEIILPLTLENIRYYAFYNCKNLKTIEIPYKVKIIADDAFLGCTNLSTVYIHSSTIAGLETSNSRLLDYANTVYIEYSIANIGTYITNNFEFSHSYGIYNVYKKKKLTL